MLPPGVADIIKEGVAVLPELAKEGITANTNKSGVGGTSSQDQISTGVNLYMPAVIGNSGGMAQPYIQGAAANGGFGFFQPSRWIGTNGTPEDDTFVAQSATPENSGPNWLLYAGIVAASIGGFFVVRRFV